MLRNRRWIYIVVLILVLALTDAGARAGYTASHTVSVTIEDIGWLHVEGGGNVHFTIGVDGDGEIGPIGIRPNVVIHYTSIIPDGKRRSVTAQLQEGSFLGLTLKATPALPGGSSAQAGFAGGEIVLSDTAVTLITGIGSVQQAQANVTYTMEIEELGSLRAGSELGAFVLFTLTSAVE